MLVGCLTVLGIVILIVIIATVFVVRSYRGWISTGIEKSVDAALVEMQLEEGERGEIMGHVNTLMTRYESKEIGLEELGRVLESIAESPLLGAALIGGVDALYLSESTLSDEEKAEGRVQLARYAQGLRAKSIDSETLEEVLASVSTTTPDENDIQLQYEQGPMGSSRFALRSADEVSDDDLRAVFAEARAKADEAEIEAVPEEIDISDTLGVAIANALGEDPSAWVPGYTLPEPEVDTEVIEDEGAGEEPRDPETDADEGP